eukprot:767734-Hanusia_phi.AAC.14
MIWAQRLLCLLAVVSTCNTERSYDSPTHMLVKRLRLRGGSDQGTASQQRYFQSRWDERMRELQPLFDAAVEEYQRETANTANQHHAFSRDDPTGSTNETVERISRILENATRDSVSEFVEENTYLHMDPNEDKDFLFDEYDYDNTTNQSAKTHPGRPVQCFWCTDAGIVSRNVTDIKKFLEERKIEERQAREILSKRNRIDCDLDEEIARRIYACDEVKQRNIDVQILDPFNETTHAYSDRIKLKLQEFRERKEELALPVSLSNFTPNDKLNISMVEEMFREREQRQSKKQEMVIPTFHGNTTVKVANLTPAFQFNYEINESQWFGIDGRLREVEYKEEGAMFQQLSDAYKIGPPPEQIHPDVLIANANFEEELFDMSGGEEGSLKKAFRLYRRAVELNQTSSRSISSLARFLHRRHRNYEEADSLFKQALQYDEEDWYTLSEYSKMLSKWGELVNSKISNSNFTIVYYIHHQQARISRRLNEVLDKHQSLLTEEEMLEVRKETIQQVEDFAQSGFLSIPPTLQEMVTDKISDFDLEFFTDVDQFDKSVLPRELRHELLEALYRNIGDESKEKLLAKRRALHCNSKNWNETLERERLTCPFTEEIKDLLHRAESDAKAARKVDRVNRMIQDYQKKFNTTEYLLQMAECILSDKKNLTIEEHQKHANLLGGNLSNKGYDRILETASYGVPENVTPLEKYSELWRFALRDGEDPFTLLGDGTGLPFSVSEETVNDEETGQKQGHGISPNHADEAFPVPEGPLPPDRPRLNSQSTEEEEASAVSHEISQLEKRNEEQRNRNDDDDEEEEEEFTREVTPWNSCYPWRGDRNDVDHQQTAKAIFTCQSVANMFEWISKLCNGEGKLSRLQLIVARRAHRRFVCICRDLTARNGRTKTKMHEMVSDFLLQWNESLSLSSFNDLQNYGDADWRFNLTESQMMEELEKTLEPYPLSPHGKSIVISSRQYASP